MRLVRPFVVAASFVLVAACAPSPTQVLSTLETAINAGNAEQAAALFAPEGALTLDGQTYTGAAEVRAQLDAMVGAHTQLEMSAAPVVQGADATHAVRVTSNEYQSLAVPALDVELSLTAKDGKIVGVRWTLTEAARTLLTTAKTAAATKVATEFLAQVNNHNVDALRGMLTDDATVNWADQRYGDAAQVGNWLTYLGAQKVSVTPVGDATGTVTGASWKVTAVADAWKVAKIESAAADMQLRVRDGKVTYVGLVLDPAATAMINAAMSKTNAVH